MKTTYKIMRTTSHTVEMGELDWPREPGYDAIAAFISPLLDGANLEHLSVLHNGKAADMFVDDEGSLKRLPRNELATSIYRAYSRSRNPKIEPESLPAIYGTAIIFDRRVWW